MNYNIFDEYTYFSYGFTRNRDTGMESNFDKLITFIYIQSGSLLINFPNSQENFIVNAGEMVYLPMIKTRRIEFPDDQEVVGKVFCFRYWPDVDELDYVSQKISIPEEIKEHFYAIPTMSEKPKINSNYIWKVYRFLSKIQPFMMRNKSKNLEKIQKVLEYMKENDSYSIPELVKISGMSKSRFYEAFLTIVGVPPIKMKHRLQAYKGELLLKSTDLSIEEITKKLGFLSEAHFRKVFHSRYGECSPLKFRKEFQNNNRE